MDKDRSMYGKRVWQLAWVIAVVLGALKTAGVIDISIVWVFAPVWIIAVCVVLLFGIWWTLIGLSSILSKTSESVEEWNKQLNKKRGEM